MIFSILLCLAPLAALFAACVGLKRCTLGFALAAALLGFLSLGPIALIQLLAVPALTEPGTRLFFRLLRALLLNGLIEEGVKFLCLLPLARPRALPGASSGEPALSGALPGKRERPLSVLVCGGAIGGLTVGCLEAMLYFAAGAERILLRLATAALIHTCCAVLSVLCAGSFLRGRKRPGLFALAAALHGVYNFFAAFTGWFWWFSLAALLLAALECRVWYIKLTTPEQSDKL